MRATAPSSARNVDLRCGEWRTVSASVAAAAVGVRSRVASRIDEFTFSAATSCRTCRREQLAAVGPLAMGNGARAEPIPNSPTAEAGLWKCVHNSRGALTGC